MQSPSQTQIFMKKLGWNTASNPRPHNFVIRMVFHGNQLPAVKSNYLYQIFRILVETSCAATFNWQARLLLDNTEIELQRLILPSRWSVSSQDTAQEELISSCLHLHLHKQILNQITCVIIQGRSDRREAIESQSCNSCNWLIALIVKIKEQHLLSSVSSIVESNHQNHLDAKMNPVIK